MPNDVESILEFRKRALREEAHGMALIFQDYIDAALASGTDTAIVNRYLRLVRRAMFRPQLVKAARVTR